MNIHGVVDNVDFHEFILTINGIFQLMVNGHSGPPGIPVTCHVTGELNPGTGRAGVETTVVTYVLVTVPEIRSVTFSPVPVRLVMDQWF